MSPFRFLQAYTLPEFMAAFYKELDVLMVPPCYRPDEGHLKAMYGRAFTVKDTVNDFKLRMRSFQNYPIPSMENSNGG